MTILKLALNIKSIVKSQETKKHEIQRISTIVKNDNDEEN